jgi:hypothetical protein
VQTSLHAPLDNQRSRKKCAAHSIGRFRRDNPTMPRRPGDPSPGFMAEARPLLADGLQPQPARAPTVGTNPPGRVDELRREWRGGSACGCGQTISTG